MVLITVISSLFIFMVLRIFFLRFVSLEITLFMKDIRLLPNLFPAAYESIEYKSKQTSIEVMIIFINIIYKWLVYVMFLDLFTNGQKL